MHCESALNMSKIVIIIKKDLFSVNISLNESLSCGFYQFI